MQVTLPHIVVHSEHVNGKRYSIGYLAAEGGTVAFLQQH